jgi:hypothetical protein
MSVSRRDFLRLRTNNQERILELSCRMLFMRCSDAAIGAPTAEEYEQSVGEPPAVLTRRTPSEMFEEIARDLRDVQVLRLVEPEWLENIPGGARFQTMLDAFRARGGRIEIRRAANA